MEAFKGAIEVGAHAIETDIHLSKDGVVVLSHVGGHTFGGLPGETLSDCLGRYIETMLWRGQKNHRLHVGLSKNSSNTQGTA